MFLLIGARFEYKPDRGKLCNTGGKKRFLPKEDSLRVV